MIVVSLSGFDDVIADDGDSCVFEFVAELEVYLAVEN